MEKAGLSAGKISFRLFFSRITCLISDSLAFTPAVSSLSREHTSSMIHMLLKFSSVALFRRMINTSSQNTAVSVCSKLAGLCAERR